MEAKFLESGLKELNNLCREEYHESLDDLLGTSDEELSERRIGRLVGIFIKEPFARPRVFDTPSEHSGAYRSWDLVDQESYDALDKHNLWQFDFLAHAETGAPSDPRQIETGVYNLVLNLHHEYGVFTHFKGMLSDYICGDEEIRKKINGFLKNAGAGSPKLASVTPEKIVGAVGLALGGYLVNVVPFLGLVGAPVIAAVIVILFAIGVEAFCTKHYSTPGPDA